MKVRRKKQKNLSRTATPGPSTDTNSGKTTGRGKKSRVHAQIIPIKDIWLYPLRKNFRSVLCA